MALLTFYYFVGFIFFLVCLAGVQKWFKLPQKKKDKAGFIVLSVFLLLVIGFFTATAFGVSPIDAENTMFLGIIFFFLLVVFSVFFIMWYNDKYGKKINVGTVMIVICLSAFGIIFLYLKEWGSNEKDDFIKNISLKTVVSNISFDTHKPYFKEMTLADGQYLPMPEAMNETLHIGDSIYKIKGEKFYTVVNAKTKLQTQYLVATHIRVLGKPQ